MYRKKFIYSLSFVFVLGIFIVSVINNTYAMPTNLLNDGNNGGVQFLGADGIIYPMMTCTLSYTGCDDDTMNSSCNSVGGTLSGNTCTWEMVDNGENKCGSSTKVCKTEEPEPTGQCYICAWESDLHYWSSNGTAPAYGSNGCSGSWNVSALKNEAACEGSSIPPKDDNDHDHNVSIERNCYTCSTEDKIFRRYEYNEPTDGTDNCTGWEIDRTVSQANCQNESKQCYVCDNNYVWDYTKPADGTENCTDWSLNSNLDKANCKYIKPEPVPENSCYKCENDEKLFHWGLKPESGSKNCSGNWKEESSITEENNCKYVEPEIENPPTGSTLLYIMYIMIAISLSYTGYTAYKLIKAKQE